MSARSLDDGYGRLACDCLLTRRPTDRPRELRPRRLEIDKMRLLLVLFCALGADALIAGSALRTPNLRPAAAAIRCQEEEAPDASPATPERPTRRVCDFPGCDGNGRAIGGLAAIPLFEWWPIKAYRPCPRCAEAGIKYSRTGQSLDEIVFKKNPKGGYYGDD
jgi:hypothetical protein